MFKHIGKLLALSTLALPLLSVAATDLADKPILTGNSVQGNVAITISAEFPTAVGSSYRNASYNNADDYIGYFDNKKCYVYHGHATDSELRYFEPVGLATNHQCTNMWSGNFLNYALTQTIDPLRKALTGGHRSVDTMALTVLEKAYGSVIGSGTNNPSSIAANANLYTPFPWASVNVRIGALGKKFRITLSGNLGNAGTEIGTAANPNIPGVVNNNDIYEFYARSQVCVAGMLEDNCTQYGTNYKPTGLIQKNSKKLNFAALGYLNHSDRARDGGVLRAQMRPLGPLVVNPGSADTPNPNPEWDANTGIFYTNPDPATALASGVSNSGVINYLNKFGLSASGYKSYDPVSELVYTASRYYRNKGNVASYTNALTAAQIDGFPVITAWNDPVQYACQANFIIGIGDTNTWDDANLPGSTSRGANEPAIPPEVTADWDGSLNMAVPTNFNVAVATNRVGALQGTPAPLSNFNTGAGNARYYMAGIAYDLHTRDIRPDFAGKQTVSTYWLDVLESGFRNDGSNRFNQFYLTAKFGGFDVPTGFDPYLGPTVALPVATWDKNGDNDPDNYYRANNPAAMMAGLDNAFMDILSKLSGSSNTFAVSSPSVISGAMSFATSYKADTWTGNVVGNTVTFSGDIPVETIAWNASTKLDAQAADTGWDTARKIATSTCVAGSDGTQTCVGTPFRPANLILSNFSVNPADQANAVNFLRGDASNTGSSGTASFRTRTSVLGDIVNSKVVAVGPPRAPYTEEFNAGYPAFKSANTARSTVAYVGANDGMLHAFNGVPAGGNELFAYVPNAVIEGPTNTPYDNGIGALAKPAYDHKYFVDATPAIEDVKFADNTWHSILIGGLGKGGKAYYALDVTNPAGIASEAGLAGKVLWEFTHEDMGYTYDTPLVVKTKKYGWTVILTSGYNNDDGKGYFFLVNPQTGALLEKISTGEGSIANDAGLAHVNAFVADARDSLTDAAYAGDALGNVWRLDLSDASTIPAPTKIAAFGSNQPITVSPLIEVDKSTLKRYVFVGTGRILADSDVSSTQGQSFYAILDGTQSQPFTASTLPMDGSFPVTRSQMVDNTSTIATTGAIANSAKPMGYYIDLGNDGTSPYRVNVEMISSAGVVAFAANSLGGDACNPSGNNNLYALTYGGGKSVILNSGGSIIGSYAGTGLATNVSFFRKDGNTTSRISISNDSGNSDSIQVNPSSATGFTPLNWRELPTSD
ncbi:MAG: PilC/PilY family type IV pilus protein [Methylotenera sp.]|nr:PilC/PilY family type IV pilus protein [Methylotenera sp.]MDO9388867.1 PilC/PilY family type IV pilus protein [Methylotenera sp.]MDP2102703.1 PilC/PilY family type IV pilus protein [Methylotenera sp.]MDP2282343.1 PilC/PilY family type IV pilus protein [Methylotenera sp.]MDP3061447.1 PilC/PilY family type IV pilus protein [Methylotenera sp.]